MGWLASTKDFLRKVCGQDVPGSTFTPRAQQALALARREAERLHHNYVGTEHVLLGLMKLGAGATYNVLEEAKLNLETVCKEVEKNAPAGPIDQISSSLPYTPRVKKALAWAQEEARALHHTYIGTEHLLLGLLREGNGMAAQVLRHCGADLERIRVATLKELNPNYNSDDEFYTRHFAHVEETAREEAAKKPYPLDETPRGKKVIALACKEAQRLHHNFIGPEHLLLALIKLGVGTAYNVFEELKLNPENLRKEVEAWAGIGTTPIEDSTCIPYSPRGKKSWTSRGKKPGPCIIFLLAQNICSWDCFAKATESRCRF